MAATFARVAVAVDEGLAEESVGHLSDPHAEIKTISQLPVRAINAIFCLNPIADRERFPRTGTDVAEELREFGPIVEAKVVDNAPHLIDGKTPTQEVHDAGDGAVGVEKYLNAVKGLSARHDFRGGVGLHARNIAPGEPLVNGYLLGVNA